MVLRVEVEAGRGNQQPGVVAVRMEAARSAAAAAVQREAGDRTMEAADPTDAAVESYPAQAVATEEELGSTLPCRMWERPNRQQQLLALPAAVVPNHLVPSAQPGAWPPIVRAWKLLQWWREQSLLQYATKFRSSWSDSS
jgi:hypothetical protein